MSEIQNLIVGVVVVAVIGAVAVPRLIGQDESQLVRNEPQAIGPRGGAHWSLNVDKADAHRERSSVDFYVTANNTETGDIVKADIECSVMDNSKNVMARVSTTIFNIPAGQMRSAVLTAPLPSNLLSWWYNCRGVPTRA